MNWLDAIRLGRISNLPTVWTNTLAGTALAGGMVVEPLTLPLLVALSLAYLGGMYLNDAFDAEIDRRERPGRPIPSGRVRRRTVLFAGFAMLGASVLVFLWLGVAVPGGTGMKPAIAGLALAGLIVLYDLNHKGNPVSPVLMGLCRALVYVIAALAFSQGLSLAVIAGAALLWSYVVGLTYLAKQETLGRVANLWPLLFLAAPLVYGVWLAVLQPIALGPLLPLALLIGVALWFIIRRGPGDIGRAVVLLLAGISVLDALMIASTGRGWLAVVAAAGFPATLALQRVVPGT